MKSFQALSSLLLFFTSVFTFQTHQVSSQNLSPSQIKALFRLQKVLEYPYPLSQLNNGTKLCYLPFSPSLSISCFGSRVTELSINGNRTNSLSPAFSVDSLFTTLSKLPSLTSLCLVSLGIWGPLPVGVSGLSALKVLNLSSNYFSGKIPVEITAMSSLQNVVLNGNSFNGIVPDFKSLTSLNELDLKNNSFSGSIPMGFASFDQLQKLDLSLNKLSGKIPPFLFSLPSIQYLDLSRNGFIGAIPAKLTCGNKLGFVDISSNLLVGGLPACMLSNSSTRLVLNSWNCLSSGDSRYQHSRSYCSRDPLAAILPPMKKEEGSKSKAGLVMGIVGGIIGGAVVLVVLVFFVLKKARSDHVESVKLPKPVAVKTPPLQASPRTPADARHMSQAVRIGTLGITPYRIFTMEELEEATNGFDPSNFISDGPQGQVMKLSFRSMELPERTWRTSMLMRMISLTMRSLH